MSLPGLKYISVLPISAGNHKEELKNCLDQITLSLASNLILVKLTVFIHTDSEGEFVSKKEESNEFILNKLLGHCPAFSIVSQSPIPPFKVSLEGVLLKPAMNVSFRFFDHIPYVSLEAPDYKILWVSGLSENKRVSVEEGAHLAFTRMYKILNSEGLCFDNIVRQWNYVPQICFVDKINGLPVQHYQSFNEIRHIYYQKYLTKECFPAATGIGQNYGNFTLDFLAFCGNQNFEDQKIESPLQFNPYLYGQKVLVGETASNGGRKHAPEFERARILVSGDEIRILVSGTASIEGEITTCENDIVKQTKSTIRNIELLVSHENLKLQCTWNGFLSPVFDSLRVYVKERGDISIVERIIREKFKNIPFIVVQAEICRCDLLVEIEAELHG